MDNNSKQRQTLGFIPLSDDHQIDRKATSIPLYRSLFFRLTAGIIIVAVCMVVSVLFGNSAFDYVKSDLTLSVRLQEAKIGFRVSSKLDDLIKGIGDRAENEAIVRQMVSRADQILYALEDDDNLKGGSSTPEMKTRLKQTAQMWEDEVRPMILQTMTSLERPELRPKMDALNTLVWNYTELLNENEKLIHQSATSKINFTSKLQMSLSFVALGMILLMIWIIQDVSKRSKELAEVAKRIADGNLNVHAPVSGQDELAYLGLSFNNMTNKLSQMIMSEREDKNRLEELVRTIRETAQSLVTSATELRSGAANQSVGMKRQSDEINQAVETVYEILGRTEDAASVAKAVVKSADRAEAISKNGRQAIELSLKAMTYVKESSNEVAEGISSLSNDGKEIEEIVAKVSAIADKTNTLALNASIEASRAGDQGRGFTLVATEIRALAEESKQITSKVARTLNRISRTTQTAQELTEKGKTTAERASELVEAAGKTIRDLEAMIGESVRLAAEVQSAGEVQSKGIQKIRTAITHISSVSDLNLQTTKQNEETASKLSDLGNKLKFQSEATTDMKV